MTVPVRIRAHREGDMPFVVDTWRRSFADDSRLSRFDKDIYFKIMARHIKALSHEPAAQIRIACDEQDDDAIVGFACLTGPELHYVYVRGGKDTTLRGHGVARTLLADVDIKSYSCRTSAGERRLKPQTRGWSFACRTYEAEGIRVEIA